MDRDLHNIHFRSIRPEDSTRLQRFHKRLSMTTVEQRFHGAKLELSEPLARRFTELDGHTEAAIVATTGTRGRIVAVARYIELSPTRAEVAFVVEDAFQGRGIGRKLMRRLIERARHEGVTELVAYVLPSNERMLRLLREAGSVTTAREGGVYRVLIDISEPSGHSQTGEDAPSLGALSAAGTPAAIDALTPN